MHPFNKLMQKKKMEGKEMSPVERQAKMNVVHEMRKMASDEMSEPLKNMKKVSVASNSPEGLKEGLDKAKQVVSGQGMAHGGLAESHAPGMEEDASNPGGPDMESLEEETGDDLDHDNEEGESLEHAQAVLGGHDEGHDSPMSPDEIDARIMELMKLKEHMKSGGMPR